MSRRGDPMIVYSDNGTNFVGAENKFPALNWEKISWYITAELNGSLIFQQMPGGPVGGNV